MSDPVASVEAQRQAIYLQYRGELASAREKSFEQFDAAVLTLSSGGLALSVALLDKVVDFSKADGRSVLVASWILFTAAILATLVSFLCSQAAIDRQIKNAEDYFVHRIEAAKDRENPFAEVTVGLNRGAALCFFLAVCATVWFVSMNIL